MDPGRAAQDLESFLASRGGPLLRTASLLAGGTDTGEDLLQAALERVLRHWHRIEGDPEGYLRRTLYHLAADGWRRQAHGGTGCGCSKTAAADDRLRRAPRQASAHPGGRGERGLVHANTVFARLLQGPPTGDRNCRCGPGQSSLPVADRHRNRMAVRGALPRGHLHPGREPRLRLRAQGHPAGNRDDRGHLSHTIWVNPATYLPVRTLATLTLIPPRHQAWTGQSDYQWLKPTPANLAQLNVPIPAGFTRVQAP